VRRSGGKEAISHSAAAEAALLNPSREKRERRKGPRSMKRKRMNNASFSFAVLNPLVKGRN